MTTKPQPSGALSGKHRRAASFNLRRARDRLTALPTFFETVKPTRACGALSFLFMAAGGLACRIKLGVTHLRPLAATAK